MAQYDDLGREVPDSRPVAVPFNFGRPLSLHEQIKRFIRSELSTRAAAAESETFEEADDFDVDEDPDPVSAYEMVEAAPEWPGGVKDEDADPPQEPSRKAQDETDPGAKTPPLEGADDARTGPSVASEGPSGDQGAPGRRAAGKAKAAKTQ